MNQLLDLTEIMRLFFFFSSYHWPGDISNGIFIQPITSQKDGSSLATPPSTLPSSTLIGCLWDCKSASAAVGYCSQPIRKEQLLHSVTHPAGLPLLQPLSLDLDLKWCTVSQLWWHNVTHNVKLPHYTQDILRSASAFVQTRSEICTEIYLFIYLFFTAGYNIPSDLGVKRSYCRRHLLLCCHLLSQSRGRPFK